MSLTPGRNSGSVHTFAAAAAVLLAWLQPSHAGAQPEPAPGPGWFVERHLGVGPGTAFASEANPGGTQFQLALSVGRRAGWLRLRPESRHFALEEQPVRACVIADGSTCFQTARREITTLAVAMEAKLPFLRRGNDGPYAVAGAGAFHGRTRLQVYAFCQPGRLCETEAISKTYAETSPGILLAVGATIHLGPVPAFWEAGWQRTRRRASTATPQLERLSGYTLLPFSLGVRW